MSENIQYTPTPIPAATESIQFKISDFTKENTSDTFCMEIRPRIVFEEIPYLPKSIRQQYCPLFDQKEYSKFTDKRMALLYISASIDHQAFKRLLDDMKTFTMRTNRSISIKGNVGILFPENHDIRQIVSREALFFVTLPITPYKLYFEKIGIKVYVRNKSSDLWTYVELKEVRNFNYLKFLDRTRLFLDSYRLPDLFNLDHEKSNYYYLIVAYLNGTIDTESFTYYFFKLYKKTLEKSEKLELSQVSRAMLSIGFEFLDFMRVLTVINDLCQNLTLDPLSHFNFRYSIEQIFLKLED